VRRALAALGAFAAVHAVAFWLCWAAGEDLTRPGEPLFLFAFSGLVFGGLAAYGAYLFTEEKP